MTDKEFIKDLKDYFTEIEWNDKHVEKVSSMLNRYRDKVSKEPLIKIKHIKVPVTNKLQYGNSRSNLSLETMNEILNQVAKDEGIRPEDIKGLERDTEFVDARIEFTRRVLKKNGSQTYKSIAKVLNRHHSTVLHYIKKNRRLLLK